MTESRLHAMSDDELEALSSEELLTELDPSLANGLREIWSRTELLKGEWSDELIADRREQVSTEQRHAK